MSSNRYYVRFKPRCFIEWALSAEREDALSTSAQMVSHDSFISGAVTFSTSHAEWLHQLPINY
ncbi:hypothetical protein SPRA44_360029 [Serratia proteamaculans]|nr:hypothetical protein SPRA44_360029 [Serratia proteamaculans]